MQEYKRILGIDYGSKRIGIALSDPLCIIATPLLVIQNVNGFQQKIINLVHEYDVKTIIVGMPYNNEGEIGVKAGEVIKFIQESLSNLGVEIIHWDERFSTKRVQQTMLEMGVKKKKRQSKEKIDAMAAAVILQEYLDSKGSSR